MSTNSGSFSLERRRLRGDLIETFKIVKGISCIPFASLFSFLPQDKTRGHGLRLAREHSRLEIRKNYFSNRVIPKWNMLPNDAVEMRQCDRVQKSSRCLLGEAIPRIALRELSTVLPQKKQKKFEGFVVVGCHTILL